MTIKREGKNADALARDLLRDFCLVSVEFGVQFERFAASGGLSFAILRGLVGDMMNKGLLWRLKDTAHHLLIGEHNLDILDAGRLLDWTLGHIFHENVKLLEDAHQLQYYSRKSLDLPLEDDSLLPPMRALELMLEQSRESMSREVARIGKLLRQARGLFCAYLRGWRANTQLARLLNDREDLVRRVFGAEYQDLLDSIYTSAHEDLYLAAAASLLETGRAVEAERALARAREINPENPDLEGLAENLAALAKGKPQQRGA